MDGGRGAGANGIRGDHCCNEQSKGEPERKIHGTGAGAGAGDGDGDGDG